MEPRRMSSAEVVERGKAVYEQSIRAIMETEENIGKVLVIDIDTGEYEMADSNTEAARRLRAKRPDANLYGMRIGYRSMESFGGLRLRETR